MASQPWLNGWKEISAYCGMSIPTARRYVKRHNMTIYRLPGSGIPVALPAQLDLWLIKTNHIMEERKKA